MENVDLNFNIDELLKFINTKIKNVKVIEKIDDDTVIVKIREEEYELNCHDTYMINAINLTDTFHNIDFDFVFKIRNAIEEMEKATEMENHTELYKIGEIFQRYEKHNLDSLRILIEAHEAFEDGEKNFQKYEEKLEKILDKINIV